MNAAHPAPPPEDSIVEVLPVVRRVVAARVVDPAVRDDVVQETLARLMASRSRVEQDTLVPYAIAIARNLIASLAERAPCAATMSISARSTSLAMRWASPQT